MSATLPIVVSLLSGIVIPMITDLVTKWDAPSAIKSLIASALSALAGALTTVAWDPNAGWSGYLIAVLLAFASTFAAHHAGVSKSIKRATPNIGITGKAATGNDRNQSGQQKHAR